MKVKVLKVSEGAAGGKEKATAESWGQVLIPPVLSPPGEELQRVRTRPSLLWHRGNQIESILFNINKQAG